MTHAEALLRRPAERLCRRQPVQWNMLPQATFSLHSMRPFSSSPRPSGSRGKGRPAESMPFRADNRIGGRPRGFHIHGWTRKACRGVIHALSITLPEPAVDNTLDSTLLACKQPFGLGESLQQQQQQRRICIQLGNTEQVGSKQRIGRDSRRLASAHQTPSNPSAGRAQ